MAFGFAPPQPTSVLSKGQASSAELLKGRLDTQVSSMLDKVKDQLQELKALPNIEELTKKQVDDAVSCAAPEVNSLAASDVASMDGDTLPSSKQSLGSGQESLSAAASRQEKAPLKERGGGGGDGSAVGTPTPGRGKALGGVF